MVVADLGGSTRALCSGLLALLAGLLVVLLALQVLSVAVALWSLKIETGTAESGRFPRREPGRSSDIGIFARGARGVVSAARLMSSCLCGGVSCCGCANRGADMVAAAGLKDDTWLLSSISVSARWRLLSPSVLLWCLLSAAWMSSMRCWLVLECFAPAEADFGRNDVGFTGTNATGGVAVWGPSGT